MCHFPTHIQHTYIHILWFMWVNQLCMLPQSINKWSSLKSQGRFVHKKEENEFYYLPLVIDIVSAMKCECVWMTRSIFIALLNYLAAIIVDYKNSNGITFTLEISLSTVIIMMFVRESWTRKCSHYANVSFMLNHRKKAHLLNVIHKNIFCLF